VPFVLTGAVGVIALVSWLLVLVFGLGIDRGPVWAWAAGRPAGEVLTQVGLLLLVGLACLGVVALAMTAATLGLRSAQPRWFWPAAEAVFAVLTLVLVATWTAAPEAVLAFGLTARDWYFAMGMAVFAMVVLHMRGRQERARRATEATRRRDG
jgi:hypothetical protein